jgi:ABC-type hemin transport system ATPase subunit
VPWSALRAKPAEDEFAFAKNPLTEGAGSRLGHVVPLHVLNIATTIADEVVMPDTFRIESRGASFDGHLTHQASLH